MCVADNTVSDLTGPGREPHISRSDSDVTTELTGRVCFACTLLWLVLFLWLGDNKTN